MHKLPVSLIERKGFGVLDEVLVEGPVRLVDGGGTRYVVMDKARFEDLVEDARDGRMARIRESLEDLKAGRVRSTSVEELIKELGLED